MTSRRGWAITEEEGVSGTHEGDVVSTMTAPTLDTFGARLALVRHIHGWNMREAAIACGFPPGTWADWELRGRRPRDFVDACRRISERADVPIDWLVFGPALLPRLDSNQEPAGYGVSPNGGYAPGVSSGTFHPTLVAS